MKEELEKIFGQFRIYNYDGQLIELSESRLGKDLKEEIAQYITLQSKKAFEAGREMKNWSGTDYEYHTFEDYLNSLK